MGPTSGLSCGAVISALPLYLPCPTSEMESEQLTGKPLLEFIFLASLVLCFYRYLCKYYIFALTSCFVSI